MEPTHNNSPPPGKDRHNTTAAITAPPTEDGQSDPREPTEIHNQIASEVARLEDEQIEALIYLLQEIQEQGLPLNAATARGCVGGAKQVITYLLVEQKQQEALQEHHRHRDSLPEPQKIAFVCDALKKTCNYKAPLQRIVTKRLLGQAAPIVTKPFDKETVEFTTKRFRAHLEGTTSDFQQKVLQHYLENVLPGIEAEQEAEAAEQKAYDELMDAVKDNTVDEIRAIAKQLRSAS